MVFTDIQAVVFDAVGTVIYPDPPVAEAYQKAIQRHFGVEIQPDVVRSAVSDALRQRSDAQDLRTDEAAEHSFWADLIRKLCPRDESFQACFDDLFQHFAQADNWQCYDDTGKVLQALHRQGVKTAIASNFDRRLNSVCDGLPEFSEVDERIISSVIGWRKPAPEFFAAVVQLLDVPSHHILFVGDGIVNDVEGALAAGMQAAWICRGESAIQPPVGAVTIKSLDDIVISNRNQACTEPRES